jgi:F-type H+-transporting ATPase subunit a
MGFMALHLDTLGVSFLLGAMFLFFFYRVGQRMTTDTPSGTQNFLNMACTRFMKWYSLL